jgi:hypothetical protein
VTLAEEGKKQRRANRILSFLEYMVPQAVLRLLLPVDALSGTKPTISGKFSLAEESSVRHQSIVQSEAGGSRLNLY